MSQLTNSTAHSHGFSDNPEFQSQHQQLVSTLFETNGHLGTLQQFVKSLETNYRNNRSTVQAVENITSKSIDVIHKVTKLMTELNQLIHDINSIEEAGLNKVQKIAREKINRDVKLSVQEFQRCQLHFTEITKKINEQAQATVEAQQHQQEEQQRHIGEDDTYHTSVVIELDPINNEELAYQQNLIRERDEEIANIERGIAELNEVFYDLSSMVQEQGQLVDNIEANIDTTLGSTWNASNELMRASRYQKRSNKFCLYLLIFLTGFLILLILAVF